ncbi:YgdI/YgdR family lipoprotein [Lonsdalea iberica]|uniref:Lipoprotein YgdI/YgdR-like SH3-like domain-containing protein n=1 Tax=Lonsdalea iberica TaxID=1082703 RepID=A0A1X3RPJ7_9GAMM|nr:YgdI/YgdR family lipoprotein [Lonsdalea iberica]OSN03723.1 hypothetical protein AU511_14270 [Lonsdalea iberica]
MQPIMKSLLALSVITLLAGCSSHYVVATKEGQVLLTKGKPQVDESTGLMIFTDEDGHKHAIDNNDISQVVER